MDHHQSPPLSHFSSQVKESILERNATCMVPLRDNTCHFSGGVFLPHKVLTLWIGFHKWGAGVSVGKIAAVITVHQHCYGYLEWKLAFQTAPFFRSASLLVKPAILKPVTEKHFRAAHLSPWRLDYLCKTQRLFKSIINMNNWVSFAEYF